MSYNQKVWLAVLTVCALFWLTLISAIFSYNTAHKHEHGQQEQAMNPHQAKHNPALAQAL